MGYTCIALYYFSGQNALQLASFSPILTHTPTNTHRHTRIFVEAKADVPTGSNLGFTVLLKDTCGHKQLDNGWHVHPLKPQLPPDSKVLYFTYQTYPKKLANIQVLTCLLKKTSTLWININCQSSITWIPKRCICVLIQHMLLEIIFNYGNMTLKLLVYKNPQKPLKLLFTWMFSISQIHEMCQQYCFKILATLNPLGHLTVS